MKIFFLSFLTHLVFCYKNIFIRFFYVITLICFVLLLQNIKKRRLAAPKTKVPTSFEAVMKKWYYVDKTHAIRKLIDLITFGFMENVNPSCLKVRDPILITAPRRFGKTTMLEMFECFFRGSIPKEEFTCFTIGKDQEALDWYGRFTVINITFGFCTDAVISHEKCIEACR